MSTEVLLADDPLYEELYDVRREAEAMGNFVDRDVTPDVHALRAQSPVHRGNLRQLLGLEPAQRHERERRDLCVKPRTHRNPWRLDLALQPSPTTLGHRPPTAHHTPEQPARVLQLAGERWDEDELEARFPRLWARMLQD